MHPLSNHEAFLARAIELAREARAAGDMPFGAVLVLDGRIVVESRNTVVTKLAGSNFLIPCLELFSRAADQVQVIGPLLVDEARAVHVGFWPAACS